MKIVKKNVYYCDFCKKKGLSAGHIRTHEKHCTGNPKRECRMCELDGSNKLTKEQRKMFVSRANKMVNVFIKKDMKIDGHGTSSYRADKGENFKKKMKKHIINLIDCPACILSILREAKNEVIWYANWDYKKAVKAYIKEINEKAEKQAEHDAIYGY